MMVRSSAGGFCREEKNEGWVSENGGLQAA
jgi:hypothetical protein